MTVYGISSDGIKLMGWGSLPVPLATTAVSLRFASRHGHHSIGADDYMMFVSYFLYCGLYAALMIWAPIGKVGWPQADLSPNQVQAFFKVFFIVQVLYGLVGPCIKLSILLLYRRLFSASRIFMWTTLSVGLLVMIWLISVVFAVIFECTPAGSYWRPFADRTCIDSQKFYWANGISNLLLDFMIFCLPIPLVWQLHMSIRRKISVSLVFTLGSFVCIASVLRIAFLWKIQFDNVSGTIAIPSIWTSMEPGLGVVAGCLPTLPSLFHRFMKGERKDAIYKRLSSLVKSWFIAPLRGKRGIKPGSTVYANTPEQSASSPAS